MAGRVSLPGSRGVRVLAAAVALSALGASAAASFLVAARVDSDAPAACSGQRCVASLRADDVLGRLHAARFACVTPAGLHPSCSEQVGLTTYTVALLVEPRGGVRAYECLVAYRPDPGASSGGPGGQVLAFLSWSAGLAFRHDAGAARRAVAWVAGRARGAGGAGAAARGGWGPWMEASLGGYQYAVRFDGAFEDGQLVGRRGVDLVVRPAGAGAPESLSA
jgi:hypothetical protein